VPGPALECHRETAIFSCGNRRLRAKRDLLCRNIAQRQHQQERTDYGKPENHESIEVSQQRLFDL
jgi:hypothetical protein